MVARLSKLIDIRDCAASDKLIEPLDWYVVADRKKIRTLQAEEKFALRSKTKPKYGFHILLAPEFYKEGDGRAPCTIWLSPVREFVTYYDDNYFTDYFDSELGGKATYEPQDEVYIDYLFNVLDPDPELPTTIQDIEHPSRLDYIEFS